MSQHTPTIDTGDVISGIGGGNGALATLSRKSPLLAAAVLIGVPFLLVIAILSFFKR